MVKVITRLTGDFEWSNLSEHLGEEGKMIEELALKLDDVMPGGSARNPDLTQYKKDLETAFFLVKTGGLKTISETSNTNEWEYCGLKQRCKNCPDQKYEPWVTIDDYLR